MFKDDRLTRPFFFREIKLLLNYNKNILGINVTQCFYFKVLDLQQMFTSAITKKKLVSVAIFVVVCNVCPRWNWACSFLAEMLWNCRQLAQKVVMRYWWKILFCLYFLIRVFWMSFCSLWLFQPYPWPKPV